MYIRAKTLDDLMMKILKKLLKSNNHINSTKGNSNELDGVLLHLSNPQARLSRTEVKGKLFSCLGELMWYLSKKNDLEFIRYYLKTYEKFSDDGKTIYGGYGPRLFNMHSRYDQIKNVISLLKEKNSSRRAVIQLFDASDIVSEHKDIPCTCTLQFMIRKSRLNMFTCMRSNDAIVGLPHDFFAFTMLQEIMARTLGFELGYYKHAVGSLHLYEENMGQARQYISEGWQPTTLSMPAMPKGDPWDSISAVLNAENIIRNGKEVELKKMNLSNYWADLVRLLQIFQLTQTASDDSKIKAVSDQVSSGYYKPFIQKRRDHTAQKTIPEQEELL